MEKIDMRKLSNDERYALNKQVVRLKKLGKSGAETEELSGVDKSTVSRIWQSYLREGTTGLQSAKTGRKKGKNLLLTPDEERAIRQAIIDHAPDQLKLAGCLWTRQKISDYIKREYGKTVILRSISNYLKAWGLTCQRPTKRAYAQDDVRVKSFEEKEYPAIAARAKEENAEIYWGDETGVSNTANYERGFSPKGQPPVLKVETKRERVSMISAITNKGSVRFMMYETMTQQTLIDFMRRLVTDAPRKVFLILDNLRVHHGKIVAAWLEKNKDKIEVFFLPPYAPELNPVEYLNHALKTDVHSGSHPRRKKNLIHKVQSFMRRLQHRKEKVRAFFRHRRLAFLNCCCFVPE
jgi:transposase